MPGLETELPPLAKTNTLDRHEARSTLNAADLKSAAPTGLGVRIPPPASEITGVMAPVEFVFVIDAPIHDQIVTSGDDRQLPNGTWRADRDHRRWQGGSIWQQKKARCMGGAKETAIRRADALAIRSGF